MIWRSRALNTLILTIGCVLPSAYSDVERRVPEEAFWANVESAEVDDDALRLSLRLEEADIRGLLALLADQRGISVLISDEVEGTLSMSLVGVLASDAWALVLQASGLAERQHRGVRYVAPAASIAQREEDLLSSAQTVEQLMPLETAVLRVRYARANQLLKHLTSTHSLLSSRGEALVDERLNAVVINDLPTRIASIRELIARLDAPLEQVAIEARIVTASDNLNHQLGVQWRADLSSTDDQSEAESETEDSTSLIASTALAVSAPASTLTLGVLRAGVAVDAELSSLAEQGQARVLAKPKILTLDQSPASIQSGVQIPYQETSRSGATSTSFRNAVLSLNVLPQITPDQNIMMQLKVKQDTVGQIFNGVPSINTNEIQTSVLVGNGETLVLGGILQEDANSSERKTPILSDIPFLGKAFRRKIARQDQQELLVFITPTLVRQGDARDSVTAATTNVLND